MKDTPFVKRAYNLGLKAVPNFMNLPIEVIEYYENNLDQIPRALTRGFVIEKPEVISVPEQPLDFIVRVDRSVKPSYPDWVKKVKHTELEQVGPAEYDLRKDVEEWRHDDQKTGTVDGNTIYAKQKKDNALVDCLGLTDLLAIQAKGIKVFRALYAGKAVFGWKFVVESQVGSLDVPYLVGSGDEVVLYWCWVGNYFYSIHPALRFRK